MRYFISCSGEKSSISKEESTISNLKSLNGFPELYEARKELINLLGIQLNWNQTLPAYKLYNGRVFKKVSLENEFSISEILLIIPVDFRNEETESIIIKRLHSFIKANYQYHNLKKNELIKKGAIFLLSGTLLLIGAGYISFLKLDDFISHLILVMLEPAGWFLTWNGLDLLFTGSYKSISDLVFYSKILRSKISFNNL